MKHRVALYTLGCRLNQSESDSIASDFLRAGHQIVPFHEDADIYIVNGCTVTSRSDQKSRKALKAAARHGKAMVVATGCFVHTNPQLPNCPQTAHYVVDNKRKGHLSHLIRRHFEEGPTDPALLPEDGFGFRPAEKSCRVRSMVKIQDGCDNFCAYCIVPHTRGRPVSRPAVEVLQHIRQLVDQGCHEVVLTGVNMSHYEQTGMTFADLLRQILELKGDFRLRLSSLEPELLDDRFLELMTHEKMCPHVHLCLQSGSERILKRMRRRYTVRDYLLLVSRLRQRITDCNVTTDIIVGFPGETAEDFESTCQTVREVTFGRVHTFKYSQRAKTPAAGMPDQIDEKTKATRSAFIRDLAAQSANSFHDRFLGTHQTVLVEGVDRSGIAHGYGEHYFPVRFAAPNSSPDPLNTFQTVQIVARSAIAKPGLEGVLSQLAPSDA